MKHFFKFIVIGGLSTLIQFVVLALLVELTGMQEVIASAISYVLSGFFNYYANFHVTFSSTSRHAETLPRFLASACLGLSVNILLFSFFLYSLEGIHLIQFRMIPNYYIAQFFATGITLVLNFTVSKFWIYKARLNE
jgi:putative flippase GtrA